MHQATDQQGTEITAEAYEAPRVEVLGRLEDLTLGPRTPSAGDGVSINGPQIVS